MQIVWQNVTAGSVAGLLKVMEN